MTHHTDPELLNNVLQLLTEQGHDGFAEGLRILVNEAMRVERHQVLQAQPYERTDTRLGYANGYKPKTLTSRVGPITFRVPQVRGETAFYPSALEKGIRSEQALKLAMAEMYVQGVSTRKVSASRPAAETRLKEIVAHYAKSTPKLSGWMEENLPQGLTVFALPLAHQKRLRTSNGLERMNQELKRRTRVARVFPNEASLLRLVSALLAETSDDWESGKIYLNMECQNPPSV